ncbi:alcohol dehydrogenase superfamily, zinc-containing protein [Biscogniauxia mediterranea]|nr:alcohol dehydrogenase superfamily, zinc-containing protein [Biscogniauxia mediterranea]
MATIQTFSRSPAVAAANSLIRPGRQCCARATSGSAPLLLPRVSVRRKSGPYGYTQAKALVFSEYGEPEKVLRLHTHSISPSLPASSVLLRTLAAPINPADVNTIQGTYGVKPTFSPLIGTSEPSVIPGNEGVFEVVNPGSSSSLAKGDWVIPAKTGFGTWRTHAVAPSPEALIRVDRTGLTPLQAGTVSVNPCSAYRMLRDYVRDPPLREGDWIIQNGANSGVGRAVVQLARLWGYRSINVVRARPDPAATQRLKDDLAALGATHVLTEDELQAREFRDRVAEWTRDAGPAGVRLGLNCVGGKSAQALARALGPGATLVTYGGMSRQPVTLPTGLLIFKDLRFAGFWLSRWADANPADKARTVAEILDLVRAGRFRDVPVAPVPWHWDTDEAALRAAVQGTLDGYRDGKGVFVFGDT